MHSKAVVPPIGIPPIVDKMKRPILQYVSGSHGRSNNWSMYPATFEPGGKIWKRKMYSKAVFNRNRTSPIMDKMKQHSEDSSHASKKKAPKGADQAALNRTGTSTAMHKMKR